MVYKDKLKYVRTKHGLSAKIYAKQRHKSRERGHQPPAYSNAELKNWLFKQELFHELYAKWVEADYETDLIPSVDRIENSIGYTFDNIQLMIWEENRKKQYGEGIEQYTKQGDFIAAYNSTTEAARILKVSRTAITSCLIGYTKTSAGFKWKYKKTI